MQVAVHTQELSRLVFELPDLVLDLIERPDGAEQVLLVVQRIEHGQCLRWCGADESGGGEQSDETFGKSGHGRLLLVLGTGRKVVRLVAPLAAIGGRTAPTAVVASKGSNGGIVRLAGGIGGGAGCGGTFGDKSIGGAWSCAGLAVPVTGMASIKSAAQARPLARRKAAPNPCGIGAARTRSMTR